MPLDEATRRLAFLLQRDLRRLAERERARADRGEAVSYDSVSRMATWETKRGDVIGRWYGEIIASYVLKDRILRWSWAGRTALATATHAEVVSREGQSRNVPQLSMSVIGDIDEEDAITLARLGVLVARGEGLQVLRSEAEIGFVGLFDSPRPREGEVQDPSRYSVPPPPVSQQQGGAKKSASSPPPPTNTNRPASNRPRQASSPPPVAPYRSLPPIREIYGPRSAQKGTQEKDKEAPEPPAKAPAAAVPTVPKPAAVPAVAAATPPTPSAARTSVKVREPARAVFLPVATGVLSGLTKAVPGFRQALFVLTVDEVSGEKRRLIVLLVAVDASGILRQLDPSHDLVEAAARMVEADRLDGNGPWRKLSARVTPKPDGGATLNVDVL